MNKVLLLLCPKRKCNVKINVFGVRNLPNISSVTPSDLKVTDYIMHWVYFIYACFLASG